MLKMEATVREAEPDDADPVNDLFVGLDEHHRDALPWLFRQPATAFRNREFFASVLADETSTILVATRDRLAGFVYVRLAEAPDLPIFVPRVRGIVDGLYVDPGYRRHGIASQLLRAAEAWARRHGASGVDISVYEFNAEAQEMFSAMGYRTLRRNLWKPLD